MSKRKVQNSIPSWYASWFHMNIEVLMVLALNGSTEATRTLTKIVKCIKGHKY